VLLAKANKIVRPRSSATGRRPQLRADSGPYCRTVHRRERLARRCSSSFCRVTRPGPGPGAATPDGRWAPRSAFREEYDSQSRHVPRPQHSPPDPNGKTEVSILHRDVSEDVQHIYALLPAALSFRRLSCHVISLRGQCNKMGAGGSKQVPTERPLSRTDRH